MPTYFYRRNVPAEIEAGLEAIGHTLDKVYHRNPQFYHGEIEDGCTQVVVVGDYPELVACYEKAGIPVEVVERPKAKASIAETEKPKRTRRAKKEEDSDANESENA